MSCLGRITGYGAAGCHLPSDGLLTRRPRELVPADPGKGQRSELQIRSAVTSTMQPLGSEMPGSAIQPMRTPPGVYMCVALSCRLARCWDNLGRRYSFAATMVAANATPNSTHEGDNEPALGQDAGAVPTSGRRPGVSTPKASPLPKLGCVSTPPGSCMARPASPPPRSAVKPPSRHWIPTSAATPTGARHTCSTTNAGWTTPPPSRGAGPSPPG
jgi:hypothetical protein